MSQRDLLSGFHVVLEGVKVREDMGLVVAFVKANTSIKDRDLLLVLGENFAIWSERFFSPKFATPDLWKGVVRDASR